MLQKYKTLKNSPNFDRLERPHKINNFQQNSHIVFFWVLEHFYALGAQLFKKNFFHAFFGPP